MSKDVKDFSILEALAFGEKQFKKYWFVLFSIIAVDILIEVSPTLYKHAVDNFLLVAGDGVYVWYSFMGFLLAVIIMIATVIMHFNVVKVFILAAEDKKVDLLHLSLIHI